MIRTTPVPRNVRVGAALVGVAGALALAGCAASEPVADPETTAPESTASTAPAPSAEAVPSEASTYVDGTYTAQGSYATPETVETVSVTVTLEGDVITAVEVVGDPQKRESEIHQAEFIGGISAAVVGKDIDEIQVSRIAGSSLTSGGFNQAIEVIKSEAAS